MCDEDRVIHDLVQDAIARTGHELVGIADSTPAALGLIEAARPDVVVVDMWLGFDSDFDIIQSTIDVGARPIVFSYHGDTEVLSTYGVQPVFVPKPDLSALQRVLSRLDVDDRSDEVVAEERRSHPARAAAGPPPNGLEDAQAFFEAISEATDGDGIVSIDLRQGADALAADTVRLLRDGDRILLVPTAVRLYLPGGGEAGVRSVLQRVAAGAAAMPVRTAAAVVVAPGEHGADAFRRLKASQ